MEKIPRRIYQYRTILYSQRFSYEYKFKYWEVNKGYVKQGSVLHFGGVANRIVSSSDNFTYKKENVDFAVLKMSKISLNKSANLSKDLNLIEKNSGDGGDFMNTRIHFGIVVKVENVIIQKVKASFLIVRVMSTLQEREVVL